LSPVRETILPEGVSSGCKERIKYATRPQWVHNV